jgi:surfactin synthase thioesterase subunit
VHALIRSWGGAMQAIDEDTLRFMIGNFRRDANRAARYERERKAWKIAAPIHAVMGSADPLTPDYEKNHRRWKDVSSTVHLAVIDGGHHYFIGDQADEAAEVVLRAAGVREAVAG